jgi:Cu(I)/Ag(I) efflux system periplasmic protein CusF
MKTQNTIRFIANYAILTLATASFYAYSQPAQSVPTPPVQAHSAKDTAEGEVRKIDKDAKKITLKHGPIKNLDMPGMTMVFQVKDPALLDKLAQLVPGDKILFTAEQQQGAFVVTGAEKATPK